MGGDRLPAALAELREDQPTRQAESAFRELLDRRMNMADDRLRRHKQLVTDRANKALLALNNYGAPLRTQGADWGRTEDQIVDLLVDLRHLCDVAGVEIDHDRLLSRVKVNYEHEVVPPTDG